MTNYYVTTSGNDSNAGTSEGTAFASPGKAAGVATSSGDRIYVKNGTYTLSSSTANVAGGRVSLSQGVSMEGYSVSAGDLAARPIISAGSITGITLVTFAGNFNVRPCALLSVELEGNSGSANRGLSGVNFTANVWSCVARNCPAGGFVGTGNLHIAMCSAIGCSIGFDIWSSAFGCVAQGCSSHGFNSVRSSIFCRASGNSGHGFTNALDGWLVHQCVAHGNSLSGVQATWDEGAVINTISTANAQYGYSIGGATNGLLFVNSAHRSNGTAAFLNTTTNKINEITLTADPYTNAAGNDFSLNNNSGGGALLRALGLINPPGGTSTGYQDIGAFQHQDAGGGSSIAFPPVRRACI